MKTLYKERRKRPGTKPLCSYFLPLNTSITLDFGKGQRKVKLGLGFVTDAIEFYLEHLLQEGLNAFKKGKLKRNNCKEYPGDD